MVGRLWGSYDDDGHVYEPIQLGTTDTQFKRTVYKMRRQSDGKELQVIGNASFRYVFRWLPSGPTGNVKSEEVNVKCSVGSWLLFAVRCRPNEVYDVSSGCTVHE